MFRCQVCHKLSELHETQGVAVVQLREYEYPERPNAYPNKGEEQIKDDLGGVGYQIVREVRGHESCVKDLQTSVIPGNFGPRKSGHEEFDMEEYLETGT